LAGYCANSAICSKSWPNSSPDFYVYRNRPRGHPNPLLPAARSARVTINRTIGDRDPRPPHTAQQTDRLSATRAKAEVAIRRLPSCSPVGVVPDYRRRNLAIEAPSFLSFGPDLSQSVFCISYKSRSHRAADVSNFLKVLRHAPSGSGYAHPELGTRVVDGKFALCQWRGADKWIAGGKFSESRSGGWLRSAGDLASTPG
jgi:hypothetical protein